MQSVRGTKVAELCQKTGNLRAVQLRLDHRKTDCTACCARVDIAFARSLCEGIDLR